MENRLEFCIGSLRPGMYRLRVVYPHWPIDTRVDAHCDGKAELAVVVEEVLELGDEPRAVGHVDITRADAVRAGRFVVDALKMMWAPGRRVAAFLDWLEGKNHW
jgi:hypothetical protein